VTRGRRVPGWLLAAACTLGGLALFAWVVRRTGPADILHGIERVGWGLAAILALAGARLAVRAAAWRLCMAPGTTLTYGRTFSAFLAGDTAGTITPFGMLASEPTKVFLTRHHLATRDSIASLAVENLLYSMSVLAMIAVGLAVMLATVPLSPAWRWSIAGALLSMAIAVPIAWRLMRGTWDERRGARSPWRERMAAARLAVVGFAAEQPGRLWRAFGFDAVFHLLAVVEVFLTLRWLLGPPSPGFGEAGLHPTLAQAIVFESLNRVIIVAFKFVPFRIGVDEALTGALAPILSLNPAAGVSLAVVRKVRSLFWAGVGLIVIGLHPTRRT
jgi:lysylphosphatidylglycerol synthase-like protein